jgi:tRNA G10  N-methylase Trm11
MQIAILGRQPALGLAELEMVFGGAAVKPITSQVAKITSDNFQIQRFGGILKAGKIIMEIPSCSWQTASHKIIQYYLDRMSQVDYKITLGISAYNFRVDPRDVQKTGLILKQKLKPTGISLRLIPNLESSLNTATSHHNKLGLSPSKLEIIVVQADDGSVVIAESTGAQNITAYASRDQVRPRRDARVGMLPPKLAQIIINLATPSLANNQNEETTNQTQQKVLLDPFCGTGVILQEAALMNYAIYGTDIADKMVEYSKVNLDWLASSHHMDITGNVALGDATSYIWRQPIDMVATEAYLGQPFSAPPSAVKLDEVKNSCNRIISDFLKNLAPQIKSGTPLCIAIPAWRDSNDYFTHLPLIETIARLGYKPHEFINLSKNELLYYRENQVVARELLVLTKI